MKRSHPKGFLIGPVLPWEKILTCYGSELGEIWIRQELARLRDTETRGRTFELVRRKYVDGEQLYIVEHWTERAQIGDRPVDAQKQPITSRN